MALSRGHTSAEADDPAKFKQIPGKTDPVSWNIVCPPSNRNRKSRFPQTKQGNARVLSFVALRCVVCGNRP